MVLNWQLPQNLKLAKKQTKNGKIKNDWNVIVSYVQISSSERQNQLYQFKYTPSIGIWDICL